MLRHQLEHHPQLAKFALEVKQLKSSIAKLKEDPGLLQDVQRDGEMVHNLQEAYRKHIAEQAGEQGTLYCFCSMSQSSSSRATSGYVEGVRLGVIGGRGSSPIKGPCCLLEQETLHLLLSTGLFQERIRV